MDLSEVISSPVTYIPYQSTIEDVSALRFAMVGYARFSEGNPFKQHVGRS